MVVLQRHVPDGLNELPDLYSEIAPGLWQGGTSREQVIDQPQLLTRFSEVERQFDAVATLYAWAAPFQWGVEERRLGFPDGKLIADYIPQIESIAEWANSHWSGGRRVLIRCAGGLNRSGLVTALTLIKSGRTPDAAIGLVRAGRSPAALSNPSFVEWLQGQTPPS